jgi:16S rRNA G966 N2-methylase RsmD
VLIIVVLFIGSTFLMVRAVSPSTASPTTTNPSSTTTTSRVIAKSRVRVQVANGTNTTGLAASFTQKLMLQGWDTLSPGNSAHVAATIIYYNPPFRKEALEIAATVRVSSSVVHPLGGANPIAGSNSDDVIVVLGPNSAIS